MESLTLEQASYLAEIIGVVAVVASLIYLALQVRGSNQAALISAFAGIGSRYDRCLEFLTLPDGAELFLAAAGDYENLNKEQQLRFVNCITQCAIIFEDWYLLEKGGFHLQDMIGRETIIHQILKTSGGRDAWKDTRIRIDPGIREVIDGIAAAKGEQDFLI